CATAKPTPAISSLMDAAVQGKTDMVLSLIKGGADIEERTSAQQTPLMMAALAGQTSTVKVLIDNGAALEVRDKFGRTPLMCALLGGNPETVQTLLDRGADINAKDYSLATSYFIASQTVHFSQTRAVLESNQHLKVNTFDLTPEEFQKKWSETLRVVFKDFEATWDQPSPDSKRLFYRAKAGDMIVLMMGEYQGKAYWAAVAPILNREAPYIVFLFYIDSLIALTNPGLSVDEREKIISHLRLTDKNPDFSPRINHVMVNGIVYSIEVQMREGTPLYFCAFPQQ
ncbi:MAG TPA: ankyrin repeat domain-containing protein, partial [Thermodesulfobacteriota bacterium]|nr:ankyrin repeat domain-containing protein [Thermodesulfobacteriota bacterium]